MKKNYCKPLRLSPTISLSYTRTHTMAKASNSKKPTSESSQTGKKRAPKSSKPAESKPKQLEWGSNIRKSVGTFFGLLKDKKDKKDKKRQKKDKDNLSFERSQRHVRLLLKTTFYF